MTTTKRDMVTHVRYYCPEGCVWGLPIALATGKYGIHTGIACPRHRLFSALEGRPRAA